MSTQQTAKAPMATRYPPEPTLETNRTRSWALQWPAHGADHDPAYLARNDPTPTDATTSLSTDAVLSPDQDTSEAEFTFAKAAAT